MLGKAGHHTLSSTETGGHHDDAESHDNRHRAMVSPITDCEVVVVRGMGQGAVDHLRQANLVPILTSLQKIEDVISAVASGSLDHDSRRIHQHHGR